MKLFVLTLLFVLSLQNELISQNSNSNDTISEQDSISENIRFEKQPLMIFDDKIIESSKELNAIDPNTIQELTVYKDDLDEFVNKYGKKAKNGIIFIYSKRYIANRWFQKFASFNKKFQKRIATTDFIYTDFEVFFNKTLLETDFLSDLEKKMDSMTIKRVKFKKAEKGGLIKIKAKKVK